jgi:glutathione S-transferase
MIQPVRASPKAARRRQQFGAEGRGWRRFAPSESVLSGALMASSAGDKGRQASLSDLFGYDEPHCISDPEGNRMSAELVLYTHPMSRGRIARWMLEEVGQPYRAEIVEFGPAMKGPDYRAVNPMGKVPALRHGDAIVTEGAAICAYLADAFPQADLAPPPGERAAYYRWLFFGAGPVEAATTNKALGVEPPEGKTVMVGYGRLSDVLDTLEIAVSRGDYLAGNRFSAADVYLGSQIGFGMMFGGIEKRPAFESYYARISQRPAALRARAIDDALVAERKKA